mgnify:CR=1 FL=1
MSKEWRSKNRNRLFAQPILQKEWPRLIGAMMEDGVHAQITDKGIVWSVKGYVITLGSVRKAWGLSLAQGGKLRKYVYENDPWGSLVWES